MSDQPRSTSEESTDRATHTPLSSLKEKWQRVVGLLSVDEWLVIGWAFAIKFLLFIFGAKAVLVLENKRLPSNIEWLRIWRCWDTMYYLDVAKDGYVKPTQLMAYPLYPWLVRALTWVVQDYYFSALILSTVALIFAVIFLRRLVCLDFSGEIAVRAVWFFLIFPTAFFLHIGYTESLFLCLVLGAFLAVRKEKWWLGGVLGALATMTRANGLALLPAFAVEVIQQWRAARTWRWRWLWLAAVPIGFCVYLLINQHVTGHVFGFVGMRREVFHASAAWPWTGIAELYRNLRRTPREAELVGGQELFFILFGFVCAVVSWFKLRPSYATWITVTWLGFSCVTFVQSSPRFSLALFPVFILLALAAQNRVWNALITMWSLLLLGLFASLLARTWWAF